MATRRHQPGTVHRLLALLAGASLLVNMTPGPLAAQGAPAAAGPEAAAGSLYAPGQLDALLAPIALYPDELLTQTLMASTYPVQVVDAYRWTQDPANKALSGDALTAALADKSWDPSVKSLVPFPQVLAMLNGKLDWMQQLGYAMTEQEKDVWDSVQRLRRQAQAAGHLQSSEQQVVRTDNGAVVIAPAQPTVVYVPVYNPIMVYGDWAWPAYPPVYVPYPPGYVVGAAVVAGIAFGAAVAINGGLWGWATPRWGYGSVNINVVRYNTINVNRPGISQPIWRPGGPGSGYRPGTRPPGGPVGAPGRPGQRPGQRPTTLPAHRPGNGANRPPTGTRPGGGAPNRPGQPPSNGGTRPGGGQGGRPGAGQGGTPGRPSQLPAHGGQRPPTGGVPGRPGQPPTQGGMRPGAGQGGGRPAFGNGGAGAPGRPAQRPAGGGGRPQGGRPAAGGGGKRLSRPGQ